MVDKISTVAVYNPHCWVCCSTIDCEGVAWTRLESRRVQFNAITKSQDWVHQLCETKSRVSTDASTHALIKKGFEFLPVDWGCDADAARRLAVSRIPSTLLSKIIETHAFPRRVFANIVIKSIADHACHGRQQCNCAILVQCLERSRSTALSNAQNTIDYDCVNLFHLDTAIVA